MSPENNLFSVASDSGSGQKCILEEIEVPDASSLTPTASRTAIGNLTEWYDFIVYRYVFPILNTVFSPHSSLARIVTFDGLPLSFVIQRINGIFWRIPLLSSALYVPASHALKESAPAAASEKKPARSLVIPEASK